MKVTYMIKNVFRDDNRIEGFNENHLLLLVYLQKFTTFQGKIYFSFNFMFEELKITYHQLRKELFTCLSDLVSWGLIQIINDIDFGNINKNTMIILDRIQYQDNYTMLLQMKLIKFYILDEDIRVKTMLYIYTLIVSGLMKKDFVSQDVKLLRKTCR